MSTGAKYAGDADPYRKPEDEADESDENEGSASE